MFMSRDIAIITAHGIGDNILGLQCAHHVGADNCDVFVAARDEVFDVVKDCFGHLFNIYKADGKLGENNYFLECKEAQDFFKSKYPFVYYVVPDLLFRNPFAFDYGHCHVPPSVIKSTRLLTKEYSSPVNTVYVGLTSSTPGYNYANLKPLLIKLGKENPNYNFYFPKISKWAGTDIDFGDLTGLPSNVVVVENPSMKESLGVLRKSCYGIFSCNGPSHLAYHYGIPRLVLDPQFEKPAWIARWKEDYSECVSINTNIIDVSRIVKTNLDVPETQLIPRRFAVQEKDWTKELIFKY